MLKNFDSLKTQQEQFRQEIVESHGNQFLRSYSHKTRWQK